ncbi:MAG TPA: hypothetical protein VK702_03085 [Candidatus Acidoferrum sp.]|nr:hypothetical protein [Candidatus Acidoferrum sp.]
MRAYDLVPVALMAIAGCAGGHEQSDASPSPQGSQDALRSCEVREFSLDGADLVVQANADGTPASIVVLRAPSDDARIKAFQDARTDFGDPRPDPRTEVRDYKDGLTQLTDMCGRPVMPSATPAATSSPS